MASLDDRDYEVLRVMQEGRVNPRLVRDRTDLDKGDINTVLVRLGRSGYVEQITRGLYEITDKGRSKLRDRRAEREHWIFHDEVTKADLESFPERTGELDQEAEYYAWLLMGVTDDNRAFYFDKVEQEIVEATSEDGELVEIESRPIEEMAHGESFADQIMNYMLQDHQHEWDRWSRRALALSFAETMKTIAPHFLTNEERIGYSFRVAFNLSMPDVMAFLGLGTATTDDFSRAALEKLEESRELREWLDDLGLLKEEGEGRAPAA
jgi:DNA-binding MarR family transcriptional regulator